jgi:hypothetical protein
VSADVQQQSVLTWWSLCLVGKSTACRRGSFKTWLCGDWARRDTINFGVRRGDVVRPCEHAESKGLEDH